MRPTRAGRVRRRARRTGSRCVEGVRRSRRHAHLPRSGVRACRSRSSSCRFATSRASQRRHVLLSWIDRRARPRSAPAAGLRHEPAHRRRSSRPARRTNSANGRAGVQVGARYGAQDLLVSGWLEGERVIAGRPAVVAVPRRRRPRGAARISGPAPRRRRTRPSACSSTPSSRRDDARQTARCAELLQQRVGASRRQPAGCRRPTGS